MKKLWLAVTIMTAISAPVQAGPACESIATFAGTVASARLAGVPEEKVERMLAIEINGQNGDWLKPIVHGIYRQKPPLTKEEATTLYYLACKREINDL